MKLLRQLLPWLTGAAALATIVFLYLQHVRQEKEAKVELELAALQLQELKKRMSEIESRA